MKILIDGDGCPVVRLTEQIAKEHNIPVIILVDQNHQIQSAYAQVITVEQGNDAADFALISQVSPGDLVITQDYGVASLALAKGSYALHQNGREYTRDNIDLLLMERHLAKKERNSRKKKHFKPIPKRTLDDDERFTSALLNFLNRIN